MSTNDNSTSAAESEPLIDKQPPSGVVVEAGKKSNLSKNRSVDNSNMEANGGGDKPQKHLLFKTEDQNKVFHLSN